MDLGKYQLKLDADLFGLRRAVRQVAPKCSESIIGASGLKSAGDIISYGIENKSYFKVLRAIQNLRFNGGEFAIYEAVGLRFSKSAKEQSDDCINFQLSWIEGPMQIYLGDEVDDFISRQEMPRLVRAIKPYIQRF